MHRLVSIRFSHYNEKARWALERFAVPYVEEGYMPMLHTLGVLRHAPRHGLGRGDKVSTRFATPLLITDDGRCVRDSAAIVRYVSDRYATPETTLYPSDEAAELEQRFGLELGPHTRRFAYFHVFAEPSILDTLATENVSRRQARVFRTVRPVMQRFVSRGLGITRERAERSLDKVRALMAELDERLADGRPYLLGECFCAADLAFACMAAPILAVSRDEGYGAFLPPLDDTPPAFAQVARELRDTFSGKFALRLFAQDRHPPRT